MTLRFAGCDVLRDHLDLHLRRREISSRSCSATSAVIPSVRSFAPGMSAATNRTSRSRSVSRNAAFRDSRSSLAMSRVAAVTLAKCRRDIVSSISEVAETVIGWFVGFFDDFHSARDYDSAHAWYSEIESRNLRTLRGETVKSFEELLLANWLFRNGVAYEYEPT
jgi:hypothetical protein